jgi:glycerophosphoryl diester phosphodiesterase
VAHRFGNSLAGLKAAEAMGVRAIEADLHLFRSRLEVRHLKTIGRIPILWDTWKLANPFSRRLVLPELLDAVEPDTELVLDLKGRDPRLAEAVRELVADRPVTICARSWPLLDAFAGIESVRRVHSVGSARQLARLRQRLGGRRLDGISIHERLLDSRSVGELRELADVIMTWPVNTPERALELTACGVDGLISDRPSLLGRALGGRIPGVATS